MGIVASVAGTVRRESCKPEAMAFSLREAVGHVPRSRPLGLAALAILALATAPLTLIVGIAASTIVLVAVAIADTLREGDQAPSRSP